MKSFQNNFKVLHTVSSMNVKSGGTCSCIQYLLIGLINNHIDAEILTFESENLVSGLPIRTIQRPKKSRFLISNNFKRVLLSSKHQIFHTHGLWQYPSYITAKVAKKRIIPYIVSPHGMLYPQALRKSGLQKKTVFALSMKNGLNNAAAVHATCMEEMQHLRNLGVKSPIAVISNAIKVQEVDFEEKTRYKFRIGYLGRIHRRKNIERLIYVWHQLGEMVNNCELVIIGAGDEIYYQFLKDEVKRLNLEGVVFTGFLSGTEKEKAINSLSYLVVPSDFENFGMIVPEALNQGIPVIASKGTPWEELESHHCGWWVDNDVNTLSKTIETAIKIPEELRQQMGKNGKRLVTENYTVGVVAKKMKRLYEWILNGGENPEFVYL